MIVIRLSQFILSLLFLTNCATQYHNTVIERVRLEAAQIGDYELEVESRGSTVTLTGRVANEDAKNKIGQIANQIEGVRTVNNRLSIDPTFKAGIGTNDQIGSNDNITGKNILERIKLDPTIRGYKVEVLSEGSRVTLSGYALSARDIEKINNLAWQQPGITRVVNLIQLKPRVSDEVIYQQIQSIIFRQPYPEMRSIKLSVIEGSVTVSGEAPSFRAVDALLSELQMVDGIIQVNSQMTVQGRPYEALWTNSGVKSYQ